MVLGLAGALSYAPLMRWHLLGKLDRASGEEVAVAGRDYLKFIGHSEGQVRDTVVAQRGSLEARDAPRRDRPEIRVLSCRFRESVYCQFL